MNPNFPGPVNDWQVEPAPSDGPCSADQTILQKELAAQKDRYQRLAADFENFKKRTRRDSERQAAADKEAFIGELLPVLDNLERVLAARQPISAEQLHEGVAITLQQLVHLLHHHGIGAVEDTGRPFNPHRHDAVAVRHDPGQPDQVVLEVVQSGYWLGDRMIRPAKVVVNDLEHLPGACHAR